MAGYQFGLLKPLRAPGADDHNSEWLGARTLGIEITEPELAIACGLGNIDPQHLSGNPRMAAIDLALDWPIPQRRAKLVTIRPDADAFGAMAVFDLRAQGLKLSTDAKMRIALVSQSDRFARGSWPGRRPLPGSPEQIDEVGEGVQCLGVMTYGIGRYGTSVSYGVEAMKHWILTAIAPEEWVIGTRRISTELFNAIESGKIVIKEATPGYIGVVEGMLPGALRLGYRLAPVVVGVANMRWQPDLPMQRKITIAQFEVGHVDLMAVTRELANEEPGWGGSSTIIGSPQGTSCRTTLKRCFELLGMYRLTQYRRPK